MNFLFQRIERLIMVYDSMIIQAALVTENQRAFASRLPRHPAIETK